MIALQARSIGKAYRIYRRPIDSLKELVLGGDRARTFWALRDVSIELEQGRSLGIVGDNGAGKSTLLRLLAGAATPTEGSVQRRGRMSAILSLGAGFHPDLSGADNIRIGCAVMGLSPAETESVFPQIVEFSELGSFIDHPLKTYSSGMSLRLGFSVATVAQPDVLLVDEHLSVGDQHFRHKCVRRILALREAGCALVFCSHDLHAIGEVCERVLWIRDGRAAMLGPTLDVLREYEDHVRARDGVVETAGHVVRSDAPAVEESDVRENRIVDLKILSGTSEVVTGERMELRIVVRLSDKAAADGVHLAIVIMRNDGLWCYGVTSRDDGGRPIPPGARGGEYTIDFVMPSVPFLSGQYSFTIALMDDRTPHAYDHRTGACAFTVRHHTSEVGLARVAHQWRRP